MRNFLAERDPGRNPQFQRRWVDAPLCLTDFQHLDRQVAPRVVENVGRHAIGRWLAIASETHGAVAAEALKQANLIRQRIGLAWEELTQGQQAA